jgi:LacI family transcriptional regulator, galactose operon repressor
MTRQRLDRGPSPVRATLRDIAAAVELDVSTVSKVLNGGDIAVRSETRRRIIRAADDLRYTPNASARALKLSRTGALGLLVPDLSNPVYGRIARGAIRQAESASLATFMAELDEDADGDASRRLVLESRVDGLIVATARDASRLVDELKRSSLPYVFVNRKVPGSSRSITVRDEGGGALAAQTLIDAGHRDLAIIGGPSSVDTARRRRAGFEATCASNALDAPAVACGPYTLAGGRSAMRRLLEQPRRPTGVFASNTLSGLGALNAILRAGYAVPDDVSLITFDDDMASFTVPALTAIRMPLHELGARAVSELTRLLDGAPPRDVEIVTAPEVVLRDSVAPPPGRPA